MNREEMLDKVNTFIEAWKQKNFPQLRIEFEGASFVLSDIIKTESLARRTITFDKIIFVNYLLGPRDIEIVINTRHFCFDDHQNKFLEVMSLLEQELNIYKAT